MKLGELCIEAGIALSIPNMYDTEITGVCSDTRALKKGNLFVAMRGLHCDGAQFAAKALSLGACAIVAERSLEGIETVVVPNAREALSRLLDAWYGHPTREMKLIGITGTNGKTSTALMLFHVLRATGHCVGLIGTLECRINEEIVTLKGQNALANMTTPDPENLYPMLARMVEDGVAH